MGWFGSKKKNQGSQGMDVTEDSSMTRFEDRHCNRCGARTKHKISRATSGSSQAYASCKGGCGGYQEVVW